MSALVLAGLSGCAAMIQVPKMIQFDDKARQEDINRHNGYYDLQSVSPGTAKMVVRTAGGRRVDFELYRSGDLCQPSESLGTVYDQGRGLAVEWVGNLLARAASGKEYVSQDLAPGQPVIVKAVGPAATIDQGYVKQIVSACGPIYSRFTPLEGHAYLVRVEWSGNTVCRQRVVDATDPDKEVAMEPEPVSMCAPN